MALWLFVLVSLFAVGESQTMNHINQTDLMAAMADMRAKYYHGFVILLKILNGTSNSPQSSDITFLMPSDEILSTVSLSSEGLNEFILSHSIPRALALNNMLHFPSGTLVPSSIPGRMLTVTNSGRSGMFVNNAKIVDSNVCMTSLIKCHGINSAIIFGNGSSFPFNLDKDLRAPESQAPLTMRGRPKHSANQKRISSLH